MTVQHMYNIRNHCLPHASSNHKYASLNLQIRAKEWEQHLAWIKQFNIGPPKANEHFTQEQFKKIGMIGLYKKEVI